MSNKARKAKAVAETKESSSYSGVQRTSRIAQAKTIWRKKMVRQVAIERPCEEQVPFNCNKNSLHVNKSINEVFYLCLQFTTHPPAWHGLSLLAKSALASPVEDTSSAPVSCKIVLAL